MIKKRKSVLFRIAVFVSVVYLGFVLISQQVQINSQKAKLVSLNDQYKAQIEQNGKTQRELTDNVKQYAEIIARDKLDYAKPGEQIFINASGN